MSHLIMPQWRAQGSPVPTTKPCPHAGFRVDQGSLLSVLSQSQMSQQPCLCPHLFLKLVPFPQLPPTRVCREGKAERLSCCRLGPLLPPGMTRNQSTSSASSRLCPDTQTTIPKPSQICKGGRNITSFKLLVTLTQFTLQPSKSMKKEVTLTHSEPCGTAITTLKHCATSVAAGQCLLAHPE